MIAIERGKLIPVNGENDSPDLENAVDVQFNPTTLKVSLSNTLKQNERNGSSRSAQFVDKSSSNLTVELIFDTTYIEQPGNTQSGSQQASSAGSSQSQDAVEQGADVRLQTKKIADTFIKPVAEGENLRAPKRCLFQWGAFEFLGMVQSFDETLDFFSPEGRPLRATVSLKLSEDRYQFRNREVDQAERNAPSLSATGAGQQDSAADQSASPIPGGSGDKTGNWRDTSLFNGVESPRMPSLSVVAIPKISIGASLNMSGGGGIGIGGNLGVNVSASGSAGFSVSGGLSATSSSGDSVGVKKGAGKSAQQTLGQTIQTTSPAFKFGNSTALGTGIEGAFDAGGRFATTKAAHLQTGSALLRMDNSKVDQSGRQFSAKQTVNRQSVHESAGQAGFQNGNQRSNAISVAGLLKATRDSGVGFD